MECTTIDGRITHAWGICVRVEQRDRAAWLMDDSDPILDTVTENLLDRLQVSGLSRRRSRGFLAWL